MGWEHVILVIPVEIKDAANRLAAIFDPDTGGSSTFGGCKLSPSGENPPTHYMAGTVIKSEYLNSLTDPQQAMVILTSLAETYGREPPQQEDVDEWCANVIVGQPEDLVKIEDEGVEDGEE